MNCNPNHALLTSQPVVDFVDGLCEFSLTTNAPQIASAQVGNLRLHVAAFPKNPNLTYVAVGVDRKKYGRNGGRMLEVTSFTEDNFAADFVLAGMLESIVELVDDGVLVPTKIG